MSENLIHLLPETLRNQIAAGEVVERPASVVKELVENALDAGAKRIEITLEEAGLKLIQVQDDGKGMSKEDAVIAVKRHTTSKISSKEDLFNIHSFGFRGEAIASIASISLFTLDSKQSGSLSGTRIEVHAGHELEPQDVACKEGTCIRVENLFDNIPVRKKFLKTDSTELKHSVETVEDIAACHPEREFRLSHNGKELLKFFPESFESRIRHIVTDEVFSSLIPVQHATPTVEIHGFVSQPGAVFKTRNYQKIFVNERPVKNSTVLAAVNDAFHSFLEKGAYPAFYLFITVPADLVDVNVHPRKLEVNFVRSSEVFQAVRNALLDAFQKKHVAFQTGESFPSFEQKDVGSFSSFGAVVPKESRPSVYPNTSFRSSAASFKQVDATLGFAKSLLDSSNDFGFHKDLDQQDELGGYKIIGQAAKKFIILEKENRIIFLDQHAVHERARYDEFMRSFREKQIPSQKLLLPEIINCHSSESIALEEHKITLERMGFEIESFGNSFQILALPVHIPNENLKETVVKICEELAESGGSRESEKSIEKALTYLSCRGAIMFGDELSQKELEGIVKDWLRFAKGLTCPHGRPLGFEMSVQEMEKKVGR